MRINSVKVLMMAALAFCWIGGQAHALDITKVTQGSIEEINQSSIRILCNANQSKFLVTIGPNTVYNNVQKLTDLKLGDEIQVNYQINHFNNVATTVTKMEVQGG